MRIGPLGPPRRRPVALALVLLCLQLGTGCLSVTFYHPQKGIHRPVVVDRADTNFAGMRVLVRCVAHEDYLPTSDAAELCANIAEEFENQGAETEYVVPFGTGWIEPDVFEGRSPDITVEIESRIDHSYNNPITIVVCILTWSMFPAVTEDSYSQRVVVLGKDRSVLVEDAYAERFVEYHGLGAWGFNYLLDWGFREPEEELMDDNAKKDFTRDFYGQVRQLAFNAKIRSELLGLTKEKRTVAPVFADEEAAEKPAAAGTDSNAEKGTSAGAASSTNDAAEPAPPPAEMTPPESAAELPGLSDDPADAFVDPAGDE